MTKTLLQEDEYKNIIIIMTLFEFDHAVDDDGSVYARLITVWHIPSQKCVRGVDVASSQI